MRLPLLIACIFGGLALLWWQFPYALADQQERMRIIYLVALLILIAAGSGRLRRISNARALRDGAIWLGILLVLVLLYSFRGTVSGELFPARLRSEGEGVYQVQAAQDGHFHIEAEINGSRELFMVDTGASDIVLSPTAARRAGFDVENLNYSRQYRTANGLVAGAPVQIKTLVFGPLTYRNVPASVNKTAMDQSLLGMRFLKQFRRYSVEGDTLSLYP